MNNFHNFLNTFKETSKILEQRLSYKLKNRKYLKYKITIAVIKSRNEWKVFKNNNVLCNEKRNDGKILKK